MKTKKTVLVFAYSRKRKKTLPTPMKNNREQEMARKKENVFEKFNWVWAACIDIRVHLLLTHRNNSTRAICSLWQSWSLDWQRTTHTTQSQCSRFKYPECTQTHTWQHKNLTDRCVLRHRLFKWFDFENLIPFHPWWWYHRHIVRTLLYHPLIYSKVLSTDYRFGRFAISGITRLQRTSNWIH